jgi:hypothetical protein
MLGRAGVSQPEEGLVGWWKGMSEHAPRMSIVEATVELSSLSQLKCWNITMSTVLSE